MKNKIVIYCEPNGTVHPVSISYGNFFLGADTVAVFTLESQIKKAIKSIKARKFDWTSISKDGKFHILLTDKSHKHLAIGHMGKVSHNEKGDIYRADLKGINGVEIGEWVRSLRAQKKLSIA